MPDTPLAPQTPNEPAAGEALPAEENAGAPLAEAASVRSGEGSASALAHMKDMESRRRGDKPHP